MFLLLFSDGSQLSSSVVSSTQDDNIKRPHEDSADNEAAEDDVSKRKKRKDNEEKEPMGKPAPVARGGPGRYDHSQHFNTRFCKIQSRLLSWLK